MTIIKIKSAIESILFASGDPVDVQKISEVFNINKKIALNIMEELIDKFESADGGIRILKLDDKYQMCSKTENSSYVRDVMDMRRRVPLSQAAMEVLAIVAYNQPVTKSFIEQVRGVDSSSIVNNLMDKILIEEKGRLELPGRPIMYGTTHNFLRCFGIHSIDDLPNLQNENIENASEATS